MALRKIIFVLLVLSISGCASSRCGARDAVDEQKVRTFASIYRNAKHVRKSEREPGPMIRLTPDTGDAAPYFPVYEPGKVRKVWVPAHVASQDRDVLVAGHWAFVMVEGPHWYIEDHGTDRISIPARPPGMPRKE